MAFLYSGFLIFIIFSIACMQPAFILFVYLAKERLVSIIMAYKQLFFSLFGLLATFTLRYQQLSCSFFFFLL